MLNQLCGFFVYEVRAETLGPLEFDNLDLENFDFVAIHSPQNITYNTGTVFVNFTSFGVVTINGYYVLGYSLDEGPVERIVNLTVLERKISATPSFELLRTLCNVTLSGVQDGEHSITVYMGYIFDQPDRYSVAAYDSMNFTVKTHEPLNLIIKPDGNVEPETDILERNGTTYIFRGNVFGTIMVEKNGVTIDGNGFTLEGKKEVNVCGVYLVGPDRSHPSCRDVLIKNLSILNFYDGIFAVGSSNISIIGNSLENAGIHFLGTANITGNLVKYNNFTDAGVFIDYSKGSLDVITENNFDNGWVIVGLSDVPIVEKNYWSDYEGKDNNEDGIGDTPHTSSSILDEEVQDNYPLMTPIPEFPSWTIPPLVLAVTLLSVIIKRKLTRSS